MSQRPKGKGGEKLMKKINMSKIAGLISPVVFLATPAAALAQNNLVPSAIQPINNIIVVVRGIIQFILILAFVIAFIMLIVGGLRWILAGGDEKSVEKARNTITAALIGLVIVLVAYAIIRIVEVFFNVTLISGSISVPVFNAP